MAKLAVGKKVPAFRAVATSDRQVSRETLLGSPFVLYFYPKDNTPGCTIEGRDFKDSFKKFNRLNVEILGVSRDSLSSHQKFKEKFVFPFDLISDAEEKLCRQFDVIREKNMYGRKVLGIERSTFLVDSQGVLRNEWRRVKVKGHVEAVLQAAKAL
jgi:peroxiredoxin Q/BCP